MNKSKRDDKSTIFTNDFLKCIFAIEKETGVSPYNDEALAIIINDSFNAGFTEAQAQAKVLVEALEKLIADGYANQHDKEALEQYRKAME